MADANNHYLVTSSLMNDRKHDGGAINLEFLGGVKVFLKFANSKSLSTREIRCPCVKYKNLIYKHTDEVRYHLTHKGFVKEYYDWSYYYEVEDNEGNSRIA